MNDNSKPAFPKWLRRIDPLLAREDENLVFQAYRQRQGRVPFLEWLRSIPLPGAVLVLGGGALFMLQARPTTILTLGLAGLALPVVVMLGAIVLLRFALSKLSDNPHAILPKSTLDYVTVRRDHSMVELHASAASTGTEALMFVYLIAADYWKPYFFFLFTLLLSTIFYIASSVPVSEPGFAPVLIAATLIAGIVTLILHFGYTTIPAMCVSDVMGKWLKVADPEEFQKRSNSVGNRVVLCYLISAFLLQWALLDPLFSFLRIAWELPPDVVAAHADALARRMALTFPAVLGVVWLFTRYIRKTILRLLPDADELYIKRGDLAASRRFEVRG